MVLAKSLIPETPGASILWKVINHEEEPKMPPNSEKLPAEMLAVIKNWIDGGALETTGSKAARQQEAEDGPEAHRRARRCVPKVRHRCQDE